MTYQGCDCHVVNFKDILKQADILFMSISINKSVVQWQYCGCVLNLEAGYTHTKKSFRANRNHVNEMCNYIQLLFKNPYAAVANKKRTA